MSQRTYSIRELANWILDYADFIDQPLTNMSLNKLLYFVYENALRRYDRKLTNAKIEAWEHGPVFREVYSSFKRFGSDPITDRATRYNARTNRVEVVNPDVDQTDCKIILEVIDSLIRVPAFILRELSHENDGAWAKVWHHTKSSNPGMEITDEIIRKSKPTASIHDE